MAPTARNSVMLAGALLLSLAAQGARAEFPAFPFSSIPACVTACVEKAGCNAVNLRCMCDKSSGAFLPEVAACIRAGCDPSMSVDTLIDPLVNTCGTMDAPVPSAAVSSAHEAATGGATGGGGGYPTRAPGEPSAVPKPPPRTTDTTLTTSTNAGTETPAASTPITTPETTSATTTEGETAPTGTAAPTSPDASDPTSAPPESAAPADRASLLGASMGILLMLAVAW